MVAPCHPCNQDHTGHGTLVSVYYGTPVDNPAVGHLIFLPQLAGLKHEEREITLVLIVNTQDTHSVHICL